MHASLQERPADIRCQCADSNAGIEIDARVGWQEHVVVRLRSDGGETGIGWLGERHGETVVPKSPQDIIGRKDGCDEWNSAKALMRTEKSE